MVITCKYRDRAELKAGEIIKINDGHCLHDALMVMSFSSMASGITYPTTEFEIRMDGQPNPKPRLPLVGMVQSPINIEHGQTSFNLKQIKEGLPPLITDHEYFTKTFISSKIDELSCERKSAIIGAIEGKSLPIYWEKFPAEERPAQERMIDYLNECHIYLGIFGSEYSEGTVLELNRAKENGMPLLIFVKNIENISERDPKLNEILDRFKDVKDGVTYNQFKTDDELKYLVQINMPNAIERLFE